MGDLAGRLGSVHTVADDRWRPIADQLGLEEHKPQPGSAALVIGTPAAVLKHAATEVGEFGFVTPVAQLAKWWQSVPAWRDDTTLDLWRAGWTPVTVDRLIAAGAHAPIEFLIGSARQTPE